MDKRYPIGTFDNSLNYSAEDLHSWKEEIKSLPLKLKAELYGVEDELLETLYREDGWSVREVIHHLGDSHMNALMRFKLALTEDNPVIKPYDEQLWAETADYKAVSVKDGLDLIKIIHRKWSALLEAMQPDDFNRTFVHPEADEQYPTDLFQITGFYAWHGNHHLAHIQLVTQNSN